MYVTTPAGCLRRRTASAARPRSKSEASAARRSPSAALRRSPTGARKQADPRRLVVESLEAAALFVAELVADCLAQVGAERLGRQAGARRVKVGDRVAARQAGELGALEQTLVVGGQDARAAAPA